MKFLSVCKISGNSEIQHWWLWYFYIWLFLVLLVIFSLQYVPWWEQISILRGQLFSSLALQLPRSEKLMFTRKIFFFLFDYEKCIMKNRPVSVAVNDSVPEKNVGKSLWLLEEAIDQVLSLLHKIPEGWYTEALFISVLCNNWHPRLWCTPSISVLCIIITFLIYMYCTLPCQTYRDSDYQVSRVFSNRAFRVQISETGLLNQLIICEETNPLQFYMQDCYKIEDQMPGV